MGLHLKIVNSQVPRGARAFDARTADAATRGPRAVQHAGGARRCRRAAEPAGGAHAQRGGESQQRQGARHSARGGGRGRARDARRQAQLRTPLRSRRPQRAARFLPQRQDALPPLDAVAVAAAVSARRASGAALEVPTGPSFRRVPRACCGRRCRRRLRKGSWPHRGGRDAARHLDRCLRQSGWAASALRGREAHATAAREPTSRLHHGDARRGALRRLAQPAYLGQGGGDNRLAAAARRRRARDELRRGSRQAGEGHHPAGRARGERRLRGRRALR
mmetsp:Transcript_12712/g.27461  ORF Transcript_12712/g.27461 Transcript_12712/m.27461 type:complete len:277 (-) Transcript_12712:269-1099(-)